MKKLYVVLDQNVLRTSELDRLISSRQGINFVLPDLAFLEMTKSEQWESTLHNSLAMLATIPHRVITSISIGEAMRREQVNSVPVTDHLTHKGATRFVRGILNSVHDKSNGVELERIKSDYGNHRAGLRRDFLNHQENKNRAVDLIDSTKEMFSDELIKRLRAKTISLDEKLEIIFHVAPLLLEKTFVRLNFSKNKAKFFLKRKPMILRYIYLKAWFCLDWIEKDGFASIREEKVTNHFLDHEYVLTATCFDGLMSADAAVNTAYQAMLRLLRKN